MSGRHIMWKRAAGGGSVMECIAIFADAKCVHYAVTAIEKDGNL